jgi:shikimate kinase
MGASIEERDDGLVIQGGRPLHGARVRSHGDHRIAMALGVLALTASSPSEIEDAECASVSFPEFWDLLAQGTGRVAPRRLVLVGFMGAGKSTVGPLVAKRLGWDFVDMDARIEERVGSSVADMFKARGEDAFRLEEEAVARELHARGEVVVAAGGGALLRPTTRELLRENALTVWLRCGLDTILQRVPADGRRPLAGNRDIMKIRLAERETSYREADVTVDASEPGPDAVAERVVATIGERLGWDTTLR